MVEQDRARERGAEQVQVDRGEDDPVAHCAQQCALQAVGAVEDDRQEEHREEHGYLRAHQLEEDQRAPGDRRREEKGDFRLGEHERRALVRHDPRQDRADGEHRPKMNSHVAGDNQGRAPARPRVRPAATAGRSGEHQQQVGAADNAPKK